MSPVFSLVLPARTGSRLLVLAALAMSGCDRQAAAPAQADARGNAAAIASPDEVPAAAPAPAAKGGAVDRSHKGEAAPAATFQRPDGTATTIAAFRGRPVLVNLWATWCAPCIAELPTLDRAAAETAGRITVLAVSQDLDAAKAAPFLAARRVTHLAPYRDPALALSVAYAANLPTTIFYDARGRELWRVSGGMDWSGPTARALLAER